MMIFVSLMNDRSLTSLGSKVYLFPSQLILQMAPSADIPVPYPILQTPDRVYSMLPSFITTVVNEAFIIETVLTSCVNAALRGVEVCRKQVTCQSQFKLSRKSDK